MNVIRIFVVIFMVSCMSASDMQRIPAGSWGGEHISVEVGEKSAKIEYDCAHGEIDGPLVVDAGGRFNLRGTHTPERGGPIREDRPSRSLPATFVGSIKGDKMTLTLKLSDSEEETFTLQKGKEANLFKCK